MNTVFKRSLDKLLRLSANGLRGYCCRFRTELGSAEWNMGLGLLALKRTSAFRRLGYSTLTEFAERSLNLSGRKTGQLLGAAEALEHLPLLSEAYRKGEIGWGKVRAIHGLATPETEKEWLKFATAHSTRDVVRRVSISPAEWKRHQALKASLRGTPTATVAKVKEVLARPIPARSNSVESPQGVGCVGMQSTAAETHDPSSSALVTSPATGERTFPANSTTSTTGETASPPNTTTPTIDETASPPNTTTRTPGETASPANTTTPTPVPSTPDERIPPTPLPLVVCHKSLFGPRPPESGLGLTALSSRAPGTPQKSRRARGHSQTTSTTKNFCDRPLAPAPPTRVRFVVEMDADDYAVFEQAETRIRARAGRRLSRGKVLAKMAESVLNEGTAKARARHQVIIHAVEDVEGGWYETDRGVLPASAEVVEEALRTGNVVKAEELSQPGASNAEARESHDSEGRRPPGRQTSPKTNARGDSDISTDQPYQRPVDKENTSRAEPNASPRGDCRTPSGELDKPSAIQESGRTNLKPPGDSATRSSNRLKSQRKPVPNGTIRRLYARAGKCCERCGTSGCGLHIHHRTPICEGGDNELQSLELLCPACHSLVHEVDFDHKLHWREARKTAVFRKATTGASHPGMPSPSGPPPSLRR